MNPVQRALVQRSFLAAASQADQLTTRFYGELFALSPEVQDLFPADVTLQRQQLFDELTAIVVATATSDELAARAERVGERHHDDSIEPHHDDVVGRALLSAMASTLGDRWTEATAVAWTVAYQEGAASMLRGSRTDQTSGQG